MVLGVGNGEDQGIQRSRVGRFEGAGYGLERGTGGHHVIDDQDSFVVNARGIAQAEGVAEVFDSFLARGWRWV